MMDTMWSQQKKPRFSIYGHIGCVQVHDGGIRVPDGVDDGEINEKEDAVYNILFLIAFIIIRYVVAFHRLKWCWWECFWCAYVWRCLLRWTWRGYVFHFLPYFSVILFICRLCDGVEYDGLVGADGREDETTWLEKFWSMTGGVLRDFILKTHSSKQSGHWQSEIDHFKSDRAHRDWNPSRL